MMELNMPFQSYIYIWRTENSNEWILLRCDADYLFNCNYTGGYIWDETTNYVKVMPQSWH